MRILDRRLNPTDKNLENRQRFLRRAKAQLKEAVRKISGSRSVSDVVNGGEVNITVGGVSEPRLRQGEAGVRDLILPGNKVYAEGDIIPRPAGGDAQGSGGADGNIEGDAAALRLLLTREEFLDLFLDDLELPDLAKRQLAEIDKEGVRRAGYSVSGSPMNIAVTRTMRLALSRRIALGRPSRASIELLEKTIVDCQDEKTKILLRAEVAELTAKMRRIPYIDPVDLRYRRFELEAKPVAMAVMFCLMDVSGSMSEHMRDLAKRFYMLLYVFLTRCYSRVDIVFIRHTDRAEEVDEQTFFQGNTTGGTIVSSALETMRSAIEQRYRPVDWNIYAAQASDGDNASTDGEKAARLLLSLLPITQYFAYIEVADGDGSNRSLSLNSSLWSVYERLSAKTAPLAMRKVKTQSEIYPVFRDLFQRRQEKGRATA
jgi:uncharacterized sporulation protein YeaH/YhbH (DUF444 family)